MLHRQLERRCLKQLANGKPRQRRRRQATLIGQILEPRTLRRRQSELKSRRVSHAHMRRQSAASGNAPCRRARAQPTFAFSQHVERETDCWLW
jgi:hypothetical protein